MNVASNLSQPAAWRAFAPISYALVLVLVLALNFLTRVGHDEQRTTELIFLMLAGLVVCARASSSLAGLFRANAAGLGLCAFFLLGAASAAMAYSPRYAFLELSIFLLLLTVALESGAQLRHAGMPGIRITLQAVGWACALHAIRILVNYSASFVLGNDLDPRDLTPGFTHIRFFNHTQTLLLPLLVLLACLTPRGARVRILWLGLASLWWMVIYATSGRGAMAGLLAGCVFAAFVLRRTAVPFLKAMACTALAGIVLYLVFLVLFPTLAGHQPFGAFAEGIDRTLADPGSRRGFIWSNALGLIRAHPWFGVGPMHFAHDAARFRWAAHPHDWILQIGVEWGLPALLCLAFALFRGMRALVRTRDRVALVEGGGVTLAALLLVAVAVLVDALVSGSIVMPQSQLAISLYLGLAFAWYGIVTPAAPAQPPAVGLRVANTVLMLAAAAAIVWGIYPEILNVMDSLPPSPQIEAINRGLRWPRLWDIGFF